MIRYPRIHFTELNFGKFLDPGISKLEDQLQNWKERSAPYQYGKQKGHISDAMSDHSLSSKLATIRRPYVRWSASFHENNAYVLTLDDASSLYLTATCVSFFPRSVIHDACMTIKTRHATQKNQNRGLFTNSQSSGHNVLDHRSCDC